MADRGAVFLMYHELEIPGRPLCYPGEGYSRYVLKEAAFQSQMQCLQRNGGRGMSVSEALALTPQNGEKGDMVAITFDDGCESDFIAAVPALEEAGYTATFYVTAGFLGQRGYMDAKQLRELSASGFEVGCHSMTHPYLTDLGNHQLQIEMVHAKEKLEEIVGEPVEHFSCPGGRWNPRVIRAARCAGYRSVASSRVHKNKPAVDAFALGRIPIRRDMGEATFQAICRGEGLWKFRLHDHLGNVAKHMLGNSLYDRGRDFLLR